MDTSDFTNSEWNFEDSKATGASWSDSYLAAVRFEVWNTRRYELLNELEPEGFLTFGEIKGIAKFLRNLEEDSPTVLVREVDTGKTIYRLGR